MCKVYSSFGCPPPPLISCSSQLFIAKGLATVCPDWFITTRGNCNWLLQQYNLEKLFFSTDSLQTKKNCDRKQECHEQIIALSIFFQLWITKIHSNFTIINCFGDNYRLIQYINWRTLKFLTLKIIPTNTKVSRYTLKLKIQFHLKYWIEISIQTLP